MFNDKVMKVGRIQVSKHVKLLRQQELENWGLFL